MTTNVDTEEVSLSDAERYRMLVEAVIDYAIFMLDRQGRVSSWNAGAERCQGYRRGEILGKHFSVFYTDEDRDNGLPVRALQTAAQEGRFESEGWRVRQDGTRFWAHVVIDPIRDAAGELLGYAKITRDLTEKKAVEDGLRRSEEQLNLLVQGVTDYALFMLDPQGHVSSWNFGAQRIKGYAPDEIIGQHFSRFYTQEDRQQNVPERGLETAMRVGRFESEGWRVRQDGTRFWANVVIDAIRSDSGELLGFAKITRDVTERREAQRALEQAREALFQAQKMEAIGRLTGGIAHDFNNLLMAVLGSLELLRKRLPADPSLRALIDNAAHGAERGAALTQRMLAFARRQPLTPQTVDLPNLVRGMRGLLQGSLGPSIRVETQFPAHLAPVHVDPNQLESALLNLALNARDAMPQGGPIIIGAVEQAIGPSHPTRLPSGDYVRLWVQDQGVGMDEDTLARAMEPFFTTKEVGKGTGLGLSVVHGVAEQSGGRVVVRSAGLGQGTTVEMWLPTADRVGNVRSTASASAPELPQVLARRILAVDDDPYVLTSTRAMLEDLGHDVISAASGLEALRVLRQENIDCVITDIAMPHITGTQLAASIRAEFPRVPVILITGSAELSAEAAELPLLSKPFRQQELQVLIERMLPA